MASYKQGALLVKGIYTAMTTTVVWTLSWNCCFIQIVVKTEQNLRLPMESSTLDLLPNDPA
jgi:hypothetical protein